MAEIIVGLEMVYGYISMFFGMGIVIGVLVTYVWKLVQRRRWPFDLTLFEKRNNGLWVVHDRGQKIVRKDGTIAFR